MRYVCETMAVVPSRQNVLRLPVQLPMLNGPGLGSQPPTNDNKTKKIEGKKSHVFSSVKPKSQTAKVVRVCPPVIVKGRNGLLGLSTFKLAKLDRLDVPECQSVAYDDLSEPYNLLRVNLLY